MASDPKTAPFGSDLGGTRLDQRAPQPYQTGVAEHTPYQRKIIERYYDRRGEIMLTRLQEIVSELAMADTDRRRDQLWKRAAQAMKTLQVPDRLAQHILTQKKPEVLAANLRDWLTQAKRSG